MAKIKKNWKPVFKFIVRIFKFIAPGKALTIAEVGMTMIHAVIKGYPKNILEVADIRKLSKG